MLPMLLQGCVEIVYITLQTLMFVMVVYWMCWFQIDAGVPLDCCQQILHTVVFVVVKKQSFLS